MMNRSIPKLTGGKYSWYSEFRDAFKGKRILVTGATGFIGGHLCEALCALGGKLYAVSIEPRAPSYIKAERYLQVDMSDYELTRSILSETRPDLIYHLAGLVSASSARDLVLPMLDNNLVSTVNLLMASSDINCERIVIIGSAEEPDNDNPGAAPTSPYAASKAAGTLYARMFHRLYHMPVVMVRPQVAYGPRQHPSKLIPYTILSLLKGEHPQISSSTRICDFIYVCDLVRGLLRAGIEPHLEGEIFELGTGRSTKISEIVLSIATLMKSSLAPDFIANSERPEEQSIVANIRKTTVQLKWEPRWSLEEGLRETIEWYDKG
jgi:nucleoside-diphosphate-sugar epimerase